MIITVRWFNLNVVFGFRSAPDDRAPAADGTAGAGIQDNGQNVVISTTPKLRPVKSHLASRTVCAALIVPTTAGLWPWATEPSFASWDLGTLPAPGLLYTV